MFESTLSPNTKKGLAILGKADILPNDSYLAGGTALALYLGHRISVDLDFFTYTKFDPNKLSKKISSIGSFTEEFCKGISLIGTFNSVKFSCFHYDYPLLHKPILYEGCAIAHIVDIAAMKLEAIAGRATKKDYIDIYTILHSGYTLEDMFSLYEKKYGYPEGNRFHRVKALTFFEDAEDSMMPTLLSPISWEEVKSYLTKEAVRIARKWFGMDDDK